MTHGENLVNKTEEIKATIKFQMKKVRKIENFMKICKTGQSNFGQSILGKSQTGSMLKVGCKKIERFALTGAQVSAGPTPHAPSIQQIG